MKLGKLVPMLQTLLDKRGPDVEVIMIMEKFMDYAMVPTQYESSVEDIAYSEQQNTLFLLDSEDF